MNAQGEFTLVSGRKVQIGFLSQSWTYDGWLEGVPTEGWNQQKIEIAVSDAGEKHRSPVFLIEPEQEINPWNVDVPYFGGRFGLPAKLPSVTCTARLHSIYPCVGEEGDFSSLVVVWWQEEYALPIAEEALIQIQNLDWENLAESGEQ